MTEGEKFALRGFCERIWEGGKERRGSRRGVECDREDRGQEFARLARLAELCQIVVDIVVLFVHS